MTVAELIEKLRGIDPTMRVIVQDCYEDEYKDATDIAVEDNTVALVFVNRDITEGK